MKVSIIIPVYNEAKTVAVLLRRVLEVKLSPGMRREVVVVNDGSTDKSEVEIKQFKSRVKYIVHPQNYGKGAAVRTAISQSAGEIILIQDADLEYNPADYTRLLEPFTNTSVKAVYGSRLAHYPLRLWGSNKTPFPLHYAANHFLTTLTNLLFRSAVTDMETCYKAVRTNLLQGINLKSNSFDIEAEITAKLLKRGIKIIEVPIVVTPRGYREGKKISWRDGLTAIWTLVKYRILD